jgi:hypothetical protein
MIRNDNYKHRISGLQKELIIAIVIKQTKTNKLRGP